MLADNETPAVTFLNSRCTVYSFHRCSFVSNLHYQSQLQEYRYKLEKNQREFRLGTTRIWRKSARTAGSRSLHGGRRRAQVRDVLFPSSEAALPSLCSLALPGSWAAACSQAHIVAHYHGPSIWYMTRLFIRIHGCVQSGCICIALRKKIMILAVGSPYHLAVSAYCVHDNSLTWKIENDNCHTSYIHYILHIYSNARNGFNIYTISRIHHS